MRKPLIEISQPFPVERRIQKTYGKKGGRRFGEIPRYDIFTTEHDIENQLQNLNLNRSHPLEARNATEFPIWSETGTQPPHLSTRNVPGSSERSLNRSVLSPEKQSTVSLSVGDSSTPRGTLCTQESHERPKLNDTDEDALLSLASLGEGSSIESFSTFSEKIDMHCEIEKVGEGSFSSVFSVHVRGTENLESSIMKVIPLRLGSNADPEETTTCKDVISEVRISEALNDVHGFLEFRGVKVVYGDWSPSFLTAFRNFKKHQRKRAENPDPCEVYNEGQYYAILEMSNAGHELSTHIRRPSAFQMYDIFWMTTIHLAMAEKLVRFEHRDLHISNICVRSMEQNERLDITSQAVQEMNSEPALKLGLSTLRVAIIDYTLSRIEREIGEVSCSAQDKLDEEDAEDFLQGEKHEDKLQRLTYETQSAYLSDIQQHTMKRRGGKHTSTYDEEDKWQSYAPRTNIYWLAYLLQILLHRTGKQQKTMYVPRSNDMAKSVQDRIRASLKEVICLIGDSDNDMLPNSAEELLETAVSKGWLSHEEISNFQQKLE